MIASGEKKNFFAAHWDWLVAGAGGLALVIGVLFMAGLFDGDGDNYSVGSGEANGGKVKGVEEISMKEYKAAFAHVENPSRITTPAEASESFLSSGTRFYCQAGDPTVKGCGRPIPEGLEACPFCGISQQKEKAKDIDSDGDGLTDEYEIAHGLDPKVDDSNEDKDGDGFSNIEEFQAKTDPSNPASHPSYLDYVKIELPIKERYLPFFFERVMQLPGGDYRYTFKDPTRKNSYGARGMQYSVKNGEEIGATEKLGTGYVVKGYEKKVVKQKIAGGSGATKEVDMSFAIVERMSDKKTFKLVINGSKRKVATDCTATLSFSRAPEGTKQFLNLAPGSEIDLRGTKYKVVEIKGQNETAEVTLEANGVKTVIRAAGGGAPTPPQS